MVTAMQDPQRYRGPDGSVYEALPDGTYRRTPPPAAPAQAGGYTIQPMTTPAERRQAEEREYDRQRDALTDDRTDRREERAIEAASRSATAAERQAQTLTAEQAKALLYGRMMRGGEADYQRAREGGYDPASGRNTWANLLDGIPFDRGFVPALIRDPQSDAGYQAERRWAEANLRQITGAAAAQDEITRVQGINFDRANDELSDQRYRTRRDTYGDTRIAAGPAQGRLPEGYPDQTDDQALPIRDLNPGETPQTLAASGRVRGDDGVWRYRRDEQGNPIITDAPPDAPGGGAGPPVVGDDGYQTALAQERANADLIRPAAGVDMALQFTAPFNDEMAYAEGFLRQGAGNIGRRLTGREIEVSADDRGRASQDVMRQDQSRFAREHPGQNLAANVLGATAFGPGAGAPTLVGRMAQGMGVGGTYGFAGSEGGVTQRLPGTAIGAVTGAVAVPAAERIVAPVAGAIARPVINAVGSAWRGGARAAGGVGNALGVPGSQRLIDENALNPLVSGMNRFADRSPQHVNALNGEAARYQAEEIAPAFADVVNDGGRGTLRALATRQTPARQSAREFADGRAAGLQDRISTQARRTISDDPRQPAQIREEITTRRNQQADQQFGAVRGDMISPDRGVLEALRAPALRPAIEEAATSALNRGDTETAMMLRNLTDDALEYGADAQITVGMADRIARSLNGRAEAFQRSGNNDAAASYFALAERLRGGARQQVPGYDQALQSYAADSGLAKATELGEQFMMMEADQFAAAVARLSPEEQQIAQAAARRAIERQAGTQGQAPGVAQRLSNGREQAARTQALTGDAEPVQRAMGTELQALRNAQGISPAQGSPTSMNQQDAGNAAGGAIGAGLDVMTGNVPALTARAVQASLRRANRGFTDAEAEAIVTAAINPAQTNELIGMLAQRMSRREARSLARAIRYQLTTNPQSAQQN